MNDLINKFHRWLSIRRIKYKIHFYLDEGESLKQFLNFQCEPHFRGEIKANMNKRVYERRRRKNHELYGEIMSIVGMNKALLGNEYIRDFYESNQ